MALHLSAAVHYRFSPHKLVSLGLTAPIEFSQTQMFLTFRGILSCIFGVHLSTTKNTGLLAIEAK